MSRLARLLVWAVVLVVVVTLGAGIWLVSSLRSDRAVTYDEIGAHFKYGSIGSEPGGSLLQPIGGALPPYWIFQALPAICSDKLPGGYASLGFLFEPGHDLPIGVSRRRRFGVDQVGLNCAVCHTSTVRDSPRAEPRVVLGMPAQQLDLQGFVQFVLDYRNAVMTRIRPGATTRQIMDEAKAAMEPIFAKTKFSKPEATIRPKTARRAKRRR